MRFQLLDMDGVFLIKPEPVADDRGAFARVFAVEDFAGRGLVSTFVQHSVSQNIRRGTVRGLHFQAEPFAETKIVRCIRGAIFDVAVDLRRGSPTFRQWRGVELTAENRWSFYIPAGCAHGFQTLTDDTEIQYLITPAYVASASGGIVWDDASLGIDWPIRSGITISDRDRNLPTVDTLLGGRSSR